jgi:hypothetical protein
MISIAHKMKFQSVVTILAAKLFESNGEVRRLYRQGSTMSIFRISIVVTKYPLILINSGR